MSFVCRFESGIDWMDSPSPLPSTPLSGVSLQGKWTFRSCTPEDCVRKKLFDQQEAAAVEEKDSSELNHWSSSSEYFSQSINDASCLSGLSGESHTNLFDENSPHQVSNNGLMVFKNLNMVVTLRKSMRVSSLLTPRQPNVQSAGYQCAKPPLPC